jgi:hypothetical protein
LPPQNVSSLHSYTLAAMIRRMKTLSCSFVTRIRDVLLYCLMMVEASTLTPTLIFSHAWKESPMQRERLLSRPVWYLVQQPSSNSCTRLHQRPLENMHSISTFLRCTLSYKQYCAWILLGNFTLLIHRNLAHVQSGDKVCGNVRWLPQLYQDTGRITYGCRPTVPRPSCPCSSQQLT